MKIIWSRKAASSFHQIETYILRTFGEKTQQDTRREPKAQARKVK